MKQFKGIAENIESHVLGIITRNPFSILRRNKLLITDEKTSLLSQGFAGLIMGDDSKKKRSVSRVKVSREVVDRLEEGDCVLINQDGTLTIVWEKKALTNFFLLTEMCDCRCLMCPQPPKVHDKTLLETSKRILDLVNINSNQTICLTGGEPTLLKEGLFSILKLIAKKYPRSTTMMLTNGKSFDDFEFTKCFVSIRPQNFLTCVSIHSDIDEIHDQIVGVKNSFYKTAMGLHNLARFREKIEIRVVVNKLNAYRLESIAAFIQRNFPFIYHCTFMGMEITGLARDNYEKVWIDPYEYQSQLSQAIRILSRADINVSIYNIPLCLVEKWAWPFTRKSISGWKNDFLPDCERCHLKNNCCGIFTTSGLFQSRHIHPIVCKEEQHE